MIFTTSAEVQLYHTDFNLDGNLGPWYMWCIIVTRLCESQQTLSVETKKVLSVILRQNRLNYTH